MKLVSLFILFFMINTMDHSLAQILTWRIKHPISGQLLELGEKGSVQEVLMREKHLPDPFYGENEKEFAWVENHLWEFQSFFVLDANQLAHDFVIIDFPSIDTYAKIYLNDELIGETANAFHSHQISIKKAAIAGLNRLKIIFTPPIIYHRAAYKARHSQLPAPNDVGEIAVASMSRKPQYQFGWDWALRMNTIGLWQAAEIRCYNNNRILQAKIETNNTDAYRANLQLSVYLDQATKESYTIESKIFGTLSDTKSHDKELRHQIVLKNPILWWPRGHGDQHLYYDTLILKDKAGQVVDQIAVRFGVRTSELIQEKDQWGTSFYFKVNGRPIFCKGANFIPQDVFPSRVTDSSTIQLIDMMHESNFNMVRVWGGGYYQSDCFYKTCDERGILVWQDFMFACAMYPGNKEFLSLVEEELTKQIPRIAAHPSVIYFNGNNEVDVAWKNWAFPLRYLIGPRTQREIERDYVRLFQELAPELVAKHSFLPYVHTSPLSNWGKEEYYNHGTMHYWGVWHGKDPMEDFGLKTGRFNAEYGFQSFPEFSTLLTFSEEKNWDLSSSVMKHHQKSYVGNGMIRKHANNLYGKTDSFREFVYFSQLTQAKAVGIAISGHRADEPRCMGTLYWQFNDCWPAPTWSSIDYYNNWKALQYQVKKDYQDVAVIERTQSIGEEKYFLISDLQASFQSKIKIVAHDLNGKVLFRENSKIDVDGVWLQEIALKSQEDEWKHQNFILTVSWTNHLDEQLTRKFFHERQKFEKSPQSTVQMTLKEEGEGQYTLELKTSAFLADCWIFSSKAGLRFSENFEQYLPGKHSIEIKSTEKLTIEDFDVMWR